MDLEKICMMFTMQEPYYGILLSAMERVPAPQITPTAGVGRAGNVFKLYYNPQFIEGLDIDEAIQVLKHEVLHIAFNHFSIWEDENPSPEVQRLRNYAADLEVNGYINTSVMKNLNPLVPSKYGWEKYAGTREYFNRLMQLLEQQRQQARKDAKKKKKQSALKGLRKIEKKCFRLNRQKKMSVAQIAAKLNITEAEVKTHLSTARKHVKSKLAGNV